MFFFGIQWVEIETLEGAMGVFCDLVSVVNSVVRWVTALKVGASSKV